MPFENAPVLSRGFVCRTRTLAITRVMTRLPYEVAPTDPATFAAVSGVSGATALAASCGPRP
jgi:hypothetical protein